MTEPHPIRVFVHLAYGFGARNWLDRWQRGEIIGINDRLPYGYFWAEEDGCTVEYSEDRGENFLGRVLRLSLRLALGFDFIHAWRNRRGIASAEIVWTHTESQHLAVLLLLFLSSPSHRPKIIAQSIWLFDRWRRLSRVRRWLYARLIARADVLTVHSPENLKLARTLFPMCRSELILFGIRGEWQRVRERRAARHPIRVVSLGNDRHRDWATLIGAVGGWDDCVLRIASANVPPALVRKAPNIEIIRPRNNAELIALYDWADIAVVAIKPNLHASGITVVEEATLCGLPVICTDTGGIGAYFSDDEIARVPPQAPAAIRDRIAALAADDRARWTMVERARARIVAGGLTSRRFAQRHAELSRELLRDGERRQAEAPAGRPAGQDRLRRSRRPAGVRAMAVVGGLLALTAGILVPGQFGVAQDTARAMPAMLDLCDFRPTFTEDFNTLSVSPRGETGSRWIAHTPWHGDFGDAAFTDPRPGFPFRVQGGILDIEARKGADGKWQSGLLASATPTGAGFAQRYGYFEMRAQLPPGPGTWPAFWLNANQPQGSKEPGVEIDILEYYGQFTDGYHSVVHVWNKLDTKKSRAADHVTKVPPGSLTGAFHTYGAEVAKDWITFYLDRHETWRTPTPAEMQPPSMVLVNLALGSGWPIDKTPNPSIMKVDYIHVYARRTPGEAGACAPQTGSTRLPPR
jgi:glycosyltransferase involved in cell wall biosynthesis